ncbi:MAG TPA: hypothetical protein VLH56_00355 [Dissulfurispiraceae bacterium]|nr:hypothetical protein [Dissulfurispiraceae bacterium]
MKKGSPVALLTALVALVVTFMWGPASAETVEESFKRTFPDFSFEDSSVR